MNEIEALIGRWRLKADQHADRRDSYTAQILRECASDLALVLETVDSA